MKIGSKDFLLLHKKYSITPEEEKRLAPLENELIQSLQALALVLLIDDDINALKLMKKILTSAGYYCVTCTSGEDALEQIEVVIPDIVICDSVFGSSKMNGFMFYQKFREKIMYANTPFIFISGLSQEAMVKDARKIGVDDFLTKPLERRLFLASVEGKLRRFHKIP